MNVKKRILTVLFALILCMVVVIPTFAASDLPRLVDNADLLTDSEESTLLSKLNEISERQQTDVVVVTADTLDGKTPMDYADDFYDYNGYASKVLLIAPHSIDGYFWMIYAMYKLDHPETARGELRMAQRNLLEEEYDELIERLRIAGFSRCYGITPA